MKLVRVVNTKHGRLELNVAEGRAKPVFYWFAYTLEGRPLGYGRDLGKMEAKLAGVAFKAWLGALVRISGWSEDELRSEHGVKALKEAFDLGLSVEEVRDKFEGAGAGEDEL